MGGPEPGHPLVGEPALPKVTVGHSDLGWPGGSRVLAPLSLLFFLVLFPEAMGQGTKVRPAPLPATHKGRRESMPPPVDFRELCMQWLGKCPVPPLTHPSSRAVQCRGLIWKEAVNRRVFPGDAVFLLLLLESFQISLCQLLSKITTS